MQRFAGRVALVTGASSGIGAAICKSLVECDMRVVGVARNIDAIMEMKQDLTKPDCLTAIACDITKDAEVYSLFETIKKSFGGVDVCINNAGMSHKQSLLEGTPEEWREMMDLNVISLCLISKLSVQSMRERNVDDGQIINISSLGGHLTATSTPLHFYTATKHAVRSITECLRLEMRELKSHIRIASISPGAVMTDFFRRQYGEEESREKLAAMNFEMLIPEDISNCLIYILSCPPLVEINDIIMRPVDQFV